MFFLFGLVILGLLWLAVSWSIVGAGAALIGGSRAVAIIRAIPAVLIVVLLGAGMMYGNWEAEAHPDEVYRKVFGVAPSSSVTSLRGYRDDDELSAIYLQFNAPAPVVKALLKGKFTLGAAALPAEWKSLPSWFDTSASSTTRVYGENKDQHAVLLYDPATGRVRFYSS